MNNREEAYITFCKSHDGNWSARDLFYGGYEAGLASQAQQDSKESAKLARRIKRLSERLEAYKAECYGKEQILTYHAGFSIGYVEGQLSILEDIAPAPEGDKP